MFTRQGGLHQQQGRRATKGRQPAPLMPAARRRLHTVSPQKLRPAASAPTSPVPRCNLDRIDFSSALSEAGSIAGAAARDIIGMDATTLMKAPLRVAAAGVICMYAAPPRFHPPLPPRPITTIVGARCPLVAA